jgi:integrase
MRTTVWHEQSPLTGKYSVRYYSPVDGKKVRVLCDTFKQMQQEKARIKTMLLGRRPGGTNPDLIPFAIFAEYIESLGQTHRASTITLKNFAVTPFLARVTRMSNITVQTINEWSTDMMAENYAKDTRLLRLRELRAFLNWCVRKNYLANNPFTHIPIPASTFVGRRLSPDELGAIYGACDALFRPFFILLVETGARRNEVLYMSWDELDMARGSWRIPKERCKTKIDRTIPLSNDAQGALLSILGPNSSANGSGLVFAGWTPFKVKYHWKRALERSGVTGRVRIHDIRHTFASAFRGRWASLKAICGWKTDAMAEKYGGHTTLEELREDLGQSTGKLGVSLGRSGPDGA